MLFPVRIDIFFTVGDNMNESSQASTLPYSLEQFEADLLKMKPRAFDTYILPLFLAGYAIQSKNAMGRWPRRILFLAGVYMGMRNYAQYKQAVQGAIAYVKSRQDTSGVSV
jgi:hypothetical protein